MKKFISILILTLLASSLGLANYHCADDTLELVSRTYDCTYWVYSSPERDKVRTIPATCIDYACKNQATGQIQDSVVRQDPSVGAILMLGTTAVIKTMVARTTAAVEAIVAAPVEAIVTGTTAVAGAMAAFISGSR